MSAEGSGVVTLTIPSVPDYVGTARLTILGVAGRMGFSYDQIEDIRLAVGEACTNAIDRAARAGGGNANANNAHITIRCEALPGQLSIEVEDHGGAPGDAPASADLDAPANTIDGMDVERIGALLMEILVDEVTVETLPGGGNRVRLVKFTQEAAL